MDDLRLCVWETRSHRRLLFDEANSAIHGVLDGRGVAVAVHRVPRESSSRRLRVCSQTEWHISKLFKGEFVDDAVAENEEVASEAEAESVC